MIMPSMVSAVRILLRAERLERDAKHHQERHGYTASSTARQLRRSSSGGRRAALRRPARSVFTTAVAERHDARAVLGDVRLVRDQHDGDAALVFSRWNSPITSTLVRESRLPVGSSASRIDGLLTSARAIATRCCWPPDNWFG